MTLLNKVNSAISDQKKDVLQELHTGFIAVNVTVYAYSIYESSGTFREFTFLIVITRSIGIFIL